MQFENCQIISVFKDDPNNSNISQEFINLIESCKNPQLVTCIGAARIGKSSIINRYIQGSAQIQQYNEETPFKVDGGMDPATKGVISYGPINCIEFAKKYDVKTELNGEFIFIDTEGLYSATTEDSLEKYQKMSKQIQSVLQVSATQIFICSGTPKKFDRQNFLDHLQMGNILQLCESETLNVQVANVVLCLNVGFSKSQVPKLQRSENNKTCQQKFFDGSEMKQENTIAFSFPSRDNIQKGDQESLEICQMNFKELTQFICDSAQNRSQLPGLVSVMLKTLVNSELDNFSMNDLAKSIEKQFNNCIENINAQLQHDINEIVQQNSIDAINIICQHHEIEKMFDNAKELICQKEPDKKKLIEYILSINGKQFQVQRKLKIQETFDKIYDIQQLHVVFREILKIMEECTNKIVETKVIQETIESPNKFNDMLQQYSKQLSIDQKKVWQRINNQQSLLTIELFKNMKDDISKTLKDRLMDLKMKATAISSITSITLLAAIVVFGALI